MNIRNKVSSKFNSAFQKNPIMAKSIMALSTAVTTASSSITSLKCDGLEGATDARDTIINTIFGVYRTWWWIPFAIAVIAYLALKDDKAKAAAKKWAIGLAVVFIGTYAWDLIMATITTMANSFGS